ncbi:MAG: uroporphyrinogen decarboxylase [Planctomycetaceae bacterium]|nr:uroporphyrinogen decarboxylase [Planctomycetaceae bacterium]MDP7275023.1 mandelate racemase/muconate lactonizing enzyme family protein [Planctomycetaceae bacterium]
MTRLASVCADCFRIPLPTAVSDSTHGTIEAFQLITVRLTDTDGATGLGYTFTVGQGGTAVRALLQDDLADWLVEWPGEEIGELWQRMWWRLHWVGRGGVASFAMAAVDIAMWDLQARRAGRPLWKHLRETVDWLTPADSPPVVTPYAGGIDLEDPVDVLLERTQERIASGFRAIKMKVGRPQLAEDVARVTAMRETVGPEIPLMVDANMRWSVDEAITAARALDGLDLTWLEEPTAPEDWDGHARIASEGGLPIAAGENLHSVAEFRELITRGAISYPEPDVATVGGITPWLEVARMAAERGLPVTTHGVHDLHVHLLAAVDHASFLEVHGFGLERFITDPLLITDGRARIPDRPGHGVALDWNRLSRHREIPGSRPTQD